MQLDYQQACRLEGQMIKFKNSQGEWSIGRVVKVKNDGLEIEELNSSSANDGYGFGFFNRRPFFRPPFFRRSFFRPPVFFPFVGFGFSPFFF
ncbi:hypothetical protein [Neobacillus drentensis]|uniref:hypothetical protein n=1 Tax=Neobacillus drentensis TaxID=220684 RepID=UPI00285733C6|nr:hypothetical protein [Neobacillus drentensis]MDR7240195.1 hypothetical protein [Neobacillus drentensis]